MLKTKNPLYKIVLILILLFIAVGMVGGLNAIAAKQSDIYMRICGICTLPALASAEYYILKGYTKDVSKYYKIFVWLFSLSQLSMLVSASIGSGSVVKIIIAAAAFALLIVAAAVKNLGRGRSLAICTAVFALSAVNMILPLVKDPGLFSSGNSSAMISFILAALGALLACLFCILTYAKYVDKASRGAD